MTENQVTLSFSQNPQEILQYIQKADLCKKTQVVVSIPSINSIHYAAIFEKLNCIQELHFKGLFLTHIDPFDKFACRALLKNVEKFTSLKLLSFGVKIY